jgi:NAD(P)H-hydrate epimerase
MEQIPCLTADQMQEVDRLMVEVYGIQLIQMMENAGRHLADLARDRFLDGRPVGKNIAVLTGSGGNGGGVLVAARNLDNWGAAPKVFLSKPLHQLEGTIKHQAEILVQMGCQLGSVKELSGISKPDLILDGIIGYSLSGAPRGPAAEMIVWANQQNSPILALDLPSGVQATTGEVFDPAIRASATLTLALPKIGLKVAPKDIVGELYLGDIGVPRDLYSQPSLNINLGKIFSRQGIISLT